MAACSEAFAYSILAGQYFPVAFTIRAAAIEATIKVARFCRLKLVALGPGFGRNAAFAAIAIPATSTATAAPTSPAAATFAGLIASLGAFCLALEGNRIFFDDYGLGLRLAASAATFTTLTALASLTAFTTLTAAAVA